MVNQLTRSTGIIARMVIPLSLILLASSGCEVPDATDSAGLSARELAIEGSRVKQAAVDGLIALRDCDIDAMTELLYSKSAAHILIQKGKRRPLEGNAREYQLEKMSDKEIESAIELVPEADLDLLRDIAVFGERVEADKTKETDPKTLVVAAVKYKIPTGKEMLSVLVRENGEWKLSSFPAFTTKILKYKRVWDAVGDYSIF